MIVGFKSLMVQIPPCFGHKEKVEICIHYLYELDWFFEDI